MYINKEMFSHFSILCTFRFYFTNIYSSKKQKTKKKNNSAFKANVHLNIISLASLFFSLQVYGSGKKRSFQTTWTVSAVVEVHFVNMQTLVDLHFCRLFVRRFHVKYKITFVVFLGFVTYNRMSRHLKAKFIVHLPPRKQNLGSLCMGMEKHIWAVAFHALEFGTFTFAQKAEYDNAYPSVGIKRFQVTWRVAPHVSLSI